MYGEPWRIETAEYLSLLARRRKSARRCGRIV